MHPPPYWQGKGATHLDAHLGTEKADSLQRLLLCLPELAGFTQATFTRFHRRPASLRSPRSRGTVSLHLEKPMLVSSCLVRFELTFPLGR
jgi:hypothetical protein